MKEVLRDQLIHQKGPKEQYLSKVTHQIVKIFNTSTLAYNQMYLPLACSPKQEPKGKYSKKILVLKFSFICLVMTSWQRA